MSKDKYTIESIISAIDKIKKYASDYENGEELYYDKKAFDACMMNFIVIGEMINKLSEEIKNRNDNIPWREIKDFRNIVTHEYFGIDADEVWDIIENKLSPLKSNLQKIIE